MTGHFEGEGKKNLMISAAGLDGSIKLVKYIGLNDTE